MSEYVVVVDEADREVRREEKLEAHRARSLHRAFSVFVFAPDGRMLLQQRAGGKYHSAGLWSNACCGHPRPGEGARMAAERRLHEEMGIRCVLSATGTVTYSIDVGRGLHEHEYNHIFVGTFRGSPRPDVMEVADWCWVGVASLKRAIRGAPAAFTAWFPVVFGRLQQSMAAQGDSFPAAVRQLWLPEARC